MLYSSCFRLSKSSIKTWNDVRWLTLTLPRSTMLTEKERKVDAIHCTMHWKLLFCPPASIVIATPTTLSPPTRISENRMTSPLHLTWETPLPPQPLEMDGQTQWRSCSLSRPASDGMCSPLLRGCARKGRNPQKPTVTYEKNSIVTIFLKIW